MNNSSPDFVKFLSLAPAIVLVARHEHISISEFVELLQSHGFGGKRSCRKLVHRLERLALITIGPGQRGDRRERSLAPTPVARELLRSVSDLLDRILDRRSAQA